MKADHLNVWTGILLVQSQWTLYTLCVRKVADVFTAFTAGRCCAIRVTHHLIHTCLKSGTSIVLVRTYYIIFKFFTCTNILFVRILTYCTYNTFCPIVRKSTSDRTNFTITLAFFILVSFTTVTHHVVPVITRWTIEACLFLTILARRTLKTRVTVSIWLCVRTFDA